MKTHWWQKEVVYQIYPRSFYDSNQDGIGDLPGIIEKLPYLQTLGITMIWLCPIFVSPMDDNGYDIADYYHIDPVFGTDEDLDQLIIEAQKRDIKIMLDLVLNHTSDEHPWFQAAKQDANSKYRDYYIFKDGKTPLNNWRSVFGGSVWEPIDNQTMYLHCFGKKQPDLNWENPELRHALYNMINHWITKGIIGFRVDAITFIKKDQTYQNGEIDGIDNLAKCTKTCRNQQGIDIFLKELNEQCFLKHDCMTVAEAAGITYDQLDDFIGDRGFFSMIFDFAYADFDIASGSEWFIRKEWTIKDLQRRIMKSQLAMQEHGWAANFIENHDQPRATTKFLKEAQQHPDAVKTLGAMYFFLRGTPFIYQGQELGMTNFIRTDIEEFNDLSSIDQYHRSLQEGFTEDEALHIVNLRSRDNTRTPMPWNADTYGGFSNIQPWLKMNDNYVDINVEQQLHDKNSIFHFYQQMIAVRKDHLILLYGTIQPLACDDHIIAYQRFYQGETVYCYFNLSNQECSIPCDQHTIILQTSNISIENTKLTLPPYQAVILK